MGDFFKCYIHEGFNSVYEENVDDPKNTVLSSDINRRPGAVTVFCITWENHFLLPGEGEDCAQHCWPDLYEINIIIPESLLCTFSHKIRMEKYYF